MIRFARVGLVGCVIVASACHRDAAPPSSPHGAYASPSYGNGAPPGAYPQAPYGAGAPPGAWTNGPAPHANGAPPGTYPNGYTGGPTYPTGPYAPGPSQPPAGPASPPPSGSPQALPAIPGFPFPNLPFPTIPGIPGVTPPSSGATTPASPSVPLPAVFGDPINALDIVYLRQRANSVLSEVRGALPAGQQASVAGVPLVVDDTPGEVNAFAACTKNGPLMAVTDGLLEISAQMARAKATDELFGTSKLSQYVKLVSQSQQPKQPIVRPAPGFFDPTQDADGRKVARQHDLLDEQLAFILGHELAHHYLQHTGCVGPQSASVTPADLGRVLSNAVPAFNQPNELAADSNGVTSLLQAGKVRAQTHWNEEGAMMTLNFFAALMQMDPADQLLFAFQASHPPPELRIPVVQQSANQWRATGGAATAWPLPFPLP